MSLRVTGMSLLKEREKGTLSRESVSPLIERGTMPLLNSSFIGNPREVSRESYPGPPLDF